MFSSTERAFLIRLGQDALFDDDPVEVYSEKSGVLHATPFCRLPNWRDPQHPAVTVNAGDADVSCQCFGDSGAHPVLAARHACRNLMDQMVQGTALLEALRRLDDRTPLRVLRSAQLTAGNGVTFTVPGAFPKALPLAVAEAFAAMRQELAEEAASAVERLGQSSVVVQVALEDTVAEIEALYRSRDLSVRRGTRDLVAFWAENVEEKVSADRRSRLVLRAVGRVARQQRSDPRVLGLVAKMWLRDAETLLGRKVTRILSEPRRLAVYGAGNQAARLEFEVYQLRRANGQVLVAVPPSVQRYLARRGANPVRCADTAASEAVLEIAASLWEPDLGAQFNSLPDLVRTAEAILA